MFVSKLKILFKGTSSVQFMLVGFTLWPKNEHETLNAYKIRKSI